MAILTILKLQSMITLTFFFFSFEQRKKGKETVLSMGIIHRSRGNWMWIWSKIMI